MAAGRTMVDPYVFPGRPTLRADSGAPKRTVSRPLNSAHSMKPAWTQPEITPIAS